MVEQGGWVGLPGRVRPSSCLSVPCWGRLCSHQMIWVHRATCKWLQSGTLVVIHFLRLAEGGLSGVVRLWSCVLSMCFYWKAFFSCALRYIRLCCCFCWKVLSVLLLEGFLLMCSRRHKAVFAASASCVCSVGRVCADRRWEVPVSALSGGFKGLVTGAGGSGLSERPATVKAPGNWVGAHLHVNGTP